MRTKGKYKFFTPLAVALVVVGFLSEPDIPEGPAAKL